MLQFEPKRHWIQSCETAKHQGWLKPEQYCYRFIGTETSCPDEMFYSPFLKVPNEPTIYFATTEKIPVNGNCLLKDKNNLKINKFSKELVHEQLCCLLYKNDKLYI